MRMLTVYQCIVQPAPVGARGCLGPGTRPFAEFAPHAPQNNSCKNSLFIIVLDSYVQKLALFSNSGPACATKQFVQKLTLYHCFGPPAGKLPQGPRENFFKRMSALETLAESRRRRSERKEPQRKNENSRN